MSLLTDVANSDIRRQDMIIRPVRDNDSEDFFNMMCRLDEETEYMMYEPGERQIRTPNTDRLRATIEAANSGGDLLLAAVNDSGEIVGFIWAERGKLNRIRHTARPRPYPRFSPCSAWPAPTWPPWSRARPSGRADWIWSAPMPKPCRGYF